MIKLKIKLAVFNLLSKLIFSGLFLITIPFIVERINLRQVDRSLIEKREKVISLISEIGIEPFIAADSSDSFGSYNILKEEFISIELTDSNENANYIEESARIIEGEEIIYRVLKYSLSIDKRNYLLEVGKSLESISHTEKNIKTVIWLFLAFIITITFLTDLQYTHRLLKPLDQIIKKLREISSPETYNKNEVLTTTEDFRMLDRALTELMERIEKLFAKEKEITVNISHELMTPISIVRSKLENILLTEGISPEIEVKIEESLKTLMRLQSLVNSLLLIARIESQQYLKNESFSLSEILKEIKEELSPVAEDAGIMMELNLDEPMKIEMANKSLIHSMFSNVVNNSIKNTGRGGTINITGIEKNRQYIVTISDSGKGMTEEQMKNLFSRFKSRNQNSGDGIGIGLAIAKTIADFHNIKVDVSSERGKGTKFLFIFSQIS